MPLLIMDNVPRGLYENLARRAAEDQRSLTEEALYLLEQALAQSGGPPKRLPDFVPGGEICAPCDLPRSSEPTRVVARQAVKRWPDPLVDSAGGRPSRIE